MSNPTRSISELVREVIERDGVIRNGLARGLINARALARYIQVAMREDASMEAIVSSIRRYPLKEITTKRQSVGKMITKLTMKNRIVVVSIMNEPSITTALARFSSEVDYGRGETLHIVSGIETVEVVIDSTNLGKLTSMIPKKNVIGVNGNLAEIVVALSEIAFTTLGVVAAIATELAMNNVNLFTYLTYAHPPHAIIVVEEKDALKSYQSLERLSKAEL